MNPNRDQPLTIVHTEASGGWGGQEIRTFREARWFRAQGHRLILVAPETSGVFRRFSADGFEVCRCAFRKGRQAFDTLRLARLFRELAPDVVSTHSSVDSWSGLLGARLAGVPVKLRYRHVSAPVHPHLLNRLLYGRWSDHVLTTAECIRRDLIAKLGVAESRVTTAATGIEPPAFTQTRGQERAALAARLRLPEEARFLGCVAVLRSWKGQDDLLRAFDQAAPELPAHHLVFVGDGPYRAPLEALRDSLAARGRVHFAGHHESPWPFFRAFDAAILPSYKDEGIPQSLLQAMFAECPAIGTSAGGIPEIVLDGQTGLLTPPRAPDQLAAAILACVRNPAATQARVVQALELARSRHTLEQMGRTVLGIVHRVLESRIASS